MLRQLTLGPPWSHRFWSWSFYRTSITKSVRKAFFDCLSVWLSKNRQRFHNEALMKGLILPLPKAMSLSQTSVKVGLLLKSLGNWLEEESSGWGSSQGRIASLHHSAAVCSSAAEHNQTHFSMERSSFILYAIILQMGRITEGPLALCFKNIFPVACKFNFHSCHMCFSNSLNTIPWDSDVWCNILWDSYYERNIKLEKTRMKTAHPATPFDL